MIDPITTVDACGNGEGRTTLQPVEPAASTPRAIRRERRTRSQLPPTPRQVDALRYIAAYVAAHGYGPRLADIAQHLDVGHVSAFEHVEGLEARGLLNRNRQMNRSRGLTLTPKGLDLVGGPQVCCPGCGHKFRTHEHAVPPDCGTGFQPVSEPQRPELPELPSPPFEDDAPMELA